MKKLGLLPLAERVSANGPGDDDKTENKPPEREMKLWVFLLFFAAYIAVAFISPYVFMFMLGATVLCAAFIPSGTLRSNGKSAENTFWNRLPFLFVGIFILIIAVTFLAEAKDDEFGDMVFAALLRLYLLSIVLTMLGRAVFLAFRAGAVSRRKRECTERVLASSETDLLEELPGGVKVLIEKEGDLFCRYYYEGENYRFIAPEDMIVVFGNNEGVEMFIDPDKPDHYYAKELFKGSAAGIVKLLIWSAVLATLLFFMR